MSDSCPRCGQDIEPGVQVCSSCGLPLHRGSACPACGIRVRKDDDYCWTCGTELEHALHCWHCGGQVWTHSSFCSSCGAPQPDLAQLLHQTAKSEHAKLAIPDRRQARSTPAQRPTPPRPSSPAPLPVLSVVESKADRLKIVTILFADVSGFTKMSENLNPEEVKDIMNDCFAGLTEEITSRGGSIDKYIGDCVMALFGTPVAREDDPERALDAALAMQAFLASFSRELKQRSGLSLSMRIGINTGKVLAGYVGHGDSQEFTVMGDAVNLASRLEHACPVGSILISHDTHRMTRGLFRFKQLEPIQVKGKSEPIQVVEVLGRQPAGIELIEPNFRGVPTRMIGRDRELSELRTAFSRVRDIQKRIFATVRSTIGTGKSRLVQEFAAWLVGEGERGLDFMRCRDYRVESTHAPLRDLLYRLVAIEGTEQPEEVAARLREYISRLALPENDPDHIEASLGHLLGIPLDRLPVLAPFAHDPEQLDSAVREGILAFYRARAAQHPVVLVVEDLHAASDAFLELLFTLASLENLPLLMVVTYRPEADEKVEQHFESLDNRIHLSLEPLSNRDAREMVLDLLQKVEALPEELTQRVIQVCQGRPLFIEEVLAHMVEKNIIQCGTEHWDLDLSRVAEIELPQSVEAAILSRVDALPEVSRETLQIASVVGDVCWEGLVSDLGIPRALAVLDDLENRQIVRFRRRSQINAEREFYFLLPAVREAVENHVLRKVKLKWHGAIAQWLDQRIRSTDEYFDRLLGHHYHQAGQTSRALPYLLRAGLKAEERGNTVRALEDLQFVWTNARGSDDQLTLDPVELAETRVSVARLLRRVGRPGEVESAFLDTRAVFKPLAQQRPEIDLALRRAGVETAWSLTQAGEHDKVTVILDEVLSGLDQQDPEARLLAASAMRRKAWISFLNKNYDMTLQLYNQGIQRIEDLGSTPVLATLWSGLGVYQSRMKSFDQAQAALDKSLQTYQALGHKEGQAGVLVNLGVLYYRQKQLDKALQHFQEAQKLNEVIGQVVTAAICRSNTGDVLLEQGNPAAARAELVGALTVFRRTRSMENRAEALQSLIGCLRMLKDKTAEKKRVNELLEVAEKIGRPVLVRKALGYACRLDVETGESEDLSRHLQSWQRLPDTHEKEREELLLVVGDVDEKLLQSIPEGLRLLLKPPASA